MPQGISGQIGPEIENAIRLSASAHETHLSAAYKAIRHQLEEQQTLNDKKNLVIQNQQARIALQEEKPGRKARKKSFD